MKIAIVSPFEERVPPLKYGGIELVIFNLVEELVKRGHDVTMFASGNSITSARLISVFKKSIRPKSKEENGRQRRKNTELGTRKIVKFLQKEKFDIVHNHIGPYLLNYQNQISSPLVTTLHGPAKWIKQNFKKFASDNYISISKKQKSSAMGFEIIANVYNGISKKNYSFSNEPGDYFAFLGRISPEKGPDKAIKLAQATGQKLIMAAKIDIHDLKFFKTKVQPKIDNKQIQFLGEINHKQKLKLLGGAKALLSPIQWEEPFGMVFIEAMACGTPIITLNRGSAPEIIKHKRTGFVCKNLEEMAKAMKKIGQVNRKACRRWVEQNFTASQMADGYLKAYKKAILLHHQRAKKEI